MLEDDARELQDRIATMLGENEPDLHRLAIRTKDDFYPLGLRINVADRAFRDYVLGDVKQHAPDVVILDNLAHLVGADYNDAKTIHELGKFLYAVSGEGNCAVIVAAHPRKQPPDSRKKPSLAKNREDFFDEVMGSSHFVNTTGSLWGIEKTAEGYSNFLGGTQRLTGMSSLTMIEMDGDGWFHVRNDSAASYSLVVHTKKRKEAWALLSEEQPFTYTEAEVLCKPLLSSKSGFTSFWNDLKRVNLIVVKDSGFVAVPIPGVVKKTPDKPVSERNKTSSTEEPATEPIPDHQTSVDLLPQQKTDGTETGLVGN